MITNREEESVVIHRGITFIANLNNRLRYEEYFITKIDRIAPVVKLHYDGAARAVGGGDAVRDLPQALLDHPFDGGGEGAD